MSVWKLRAEGGAYAPDLGEVRRALEVLPDQSAGVELRSLPAGRSIVLPATDHDQLVSWVATEAGSGARGIYWTLNPIPPDLARPAKVGDVLRRRWMLVDVDPVRPDGLEDESATDEEHKEARLTLATLRGWLTDRHWPDPVVIDSGNGWHALYRVDLPNDQASQALLRSCLLALSARFSGRAKVDCKVHNASRISKLPGTWARKGLNTATRPYRMARFAGIPADPQPVPVGLLEELAQQDPDRKKKATATVPAQPQPSGLKARATSGEGAAGWAGAALREEVQAVRTAPAGGRNDQLNTSAFNLGQIVAGGGLAREVVEQALTEAALAAGLGEGETAATIRSGLEAGAKSPRTAPERKATQGANGHTSSKAAPVRIYPLPELLATDFPPPRWAVPGLLCEGLTFLGGKPKLGKSWLALNLALTVAAGGEALGKTKVIAGDVLYLSLEDRLRRVQDRARKVLTGLNLEATSRLGVAVEWPRQDAGGLDEIARWLETAPSPRLVVLDVWAKFKPASKGGSNRSAYDQDYDSVSALKSLVDRHGVSALVVHHCKKAAAEDALDELSGTLGLAGSADGTLVLTRARSETEAELFVTGRDVEETKLALTFDTQTFVWRSDGSSAERTESKVKAAALDLFQKNPGRTISTREIMDACQLPDERRGYLRRVLGIMVDQEILERVRDGVFRYPLKGAPDDASF